jgi:hypothetical protein
MARSRLQRVAWRQTPQQALDQAAQEIDALLKK